MTKLIIYLTFIPWLLYFSTICKNALKDIKNTKINKVWFKKNVLKIFHFDNIILFAIFIFFSKNYPEASQIWLVEVLLFSVINLYLYMNTYYDKHKSNKKMEISDTSSILIILLLTLIPIIYYISSDNYINTYYIMFAYCFFNYIIVLASQKINNILINFIKMKNEKKL